MTVSNPNSALDMRNLGLRIASALVLAPLAIGAAYLGGWAFAAFWTIAALAVWWEWSQLVQPGDAHGPFVTGACALVLAVLLMRNEHQEIALFIVALGAIAVVVLANSRSGWVAGGIVYAGALLLGSVAVRDGIETGFLAMIFLFAVVWSSDVAGYFVGRAIGGPKLAPSISPKKTWSGAIGGLAASIIAAIAIVYAIGSTELVRAALLAALLSIVAQAGDLFESRVKRLFDVKDSGGFIPGHGGAMDRLDGYLAAVATLAVIDVARDFMSATPPKFIVW